MTIFSRPMKGQRHKFEIKKMAKLLKYLEAAFTIACIGNFLYKINTLKPIIQVIITD